MHVDDMLAVVPCEVSKTLLQNLAKNLTMRWVMVTEKKQEFLRQSLSKTPQGYNFGVSCGYVKQLYKNFGFGELKGSDTLAAVLDDAEQRKHRQLFGRLLWLYRLDIKSAVCQLSTHVGNATTRDESNVKRLLRYLVGNLACNKVVGSKLNVPGIASTPQGSVFVVTAADGAGDVKDRRSYSGIAVWIKGTVEDTWYPCTLVLRNRTSFVWVRVNPS